MTSTILPPYNSYHVMSRVANPYVFLWQSWNGVFIPQRLENLALKVKAFHSHDLLSLSFLR